MAKMQKNKPLSKEERQKEQEYKIWDNLAREYHSSKEFKQICEPFNELCEKYNLLYDTYKNMYEELTNALESRTVRREYSKGIGFEGGFYSPSNLDLIIGGHNRSRLYKRPPKNNTYNFEYFFDKDDKLICSKRYSDGEVQPWQIEILLYRESKVLRLYYDTNSKKLPLITESEYENGLLTKYEEGQICPDANHQYCCREVNVEIPEYEKGLLKALSWDYYYQGNKNSRMFKTLLKNSMLNRYKYIFERDEQGFLTKYTVKQVDKFEINRSVALYGKHNDSICSIPLSKRRK